MRITSDLARFTSGVRRLSGRLEDYVRAQERLASGKRFERPSQDVAGMNRAMALRSGIRAAEQSTRNSTDGLMWTNLADTTLQAAVERLQRARELAVRGATSTNSDAHDALALEVGSIRDEIVGMANTRHRGRGLFAGYSIDDAVTKVAGVWTFTGDTGAVTRRIGENELVTVNVTADDAFGFTSGTDLFTVLDDLEAHLLAGDITGIDASIGALDGALDGVTAALAEIGSAAARIEAAQARSTDHILSLRSELGQVEDVDLAEAVMELQLQETAYRAALAAFSQAGQPSLVDFLR